MPAEKQDNISGKLDAMRRLPEGYSFQAEKVWHKLEPQLKKSSVNYRAVFFAAASFLAVILFLTIPSKRHQDSGEVGVKPQQILPSNIGSEIKGTVAGSENKKSAARSGHHKILSPVEKSLTTKQTVQNVVIPTAPQKPELNAVAGTATEIQTAVVVAVKPKRRFPIAHVNELNSAVPVAEEEQVTRAKTSFAFRKHSYETTAPVANFEEGFTEQKKPKSIFPLLNSSQ